MSRGRFIAVEKNGNGKRVVAQASSLEELNQLLADKTRVTVKPRDDEEFF